MMFANVWCFLGMAIPVLFLWPLPLLHGRKPYVSGGLILTLVLLFPQTIAIRSGRYLSDDTHWRYTFLVTRAFMGVSLGLVQMNSFVTLTDLYGASLLGRPEDPRSRGGGIGVWLGLWTSSCIGMLIFGFAIGTVIAGSQPLDWSLYISILVVAVALLVNVLCPDCRGALYRRRSQGNDSDLLPVGEIMIHRVNKSPAWWGEETLHGVFLCFEMLRQPGFFAVAIYAGWVYGQAIFVTIIFASILSRLYEFEPKYAGCMILILSAGPLIAVLLSRGSWVSRWSHAIARTLMKDQRPDAVLIFTWRTISMTILLFFVIGYTPASKGPPVSLAWPIVLAAGISFLSCLAIADCHAIIMTTFDCSDLGLDPTTRAQANRQPPPPYTSIPRVSAGLACCHGFGFLFAATGTALGVVADKKYDLRATVGGVAGVFFLVTMSLFIVLVPFRQVNVGGASEPGTLPGREMAHLSILELGSMARWSEIRNRQKVVVVTQVGGVRGRRKVGRPRTNDSWGARAASGAAAATRVDANPEQWTIEHASHLTISKVRPMETEVGAGRGADASNRDQV